MPAIKPKAAHINNSIDFTDYIWFDGIIHWDNTFRLAYPQVELDLLFNCIQDNISDTDEIIWENVIRDYNRQIDLRNRGEAN